MTGRDILLAAAAVLIAGACISIARAHEPYSAWKDRLGYSCCSERDCRPVRADMDDAGRWRVYVNGRWVNVPTEAVLPIPSPDRRSHVCMAPSALEPHCFVAGEVRG